MKAHISPVAPTALVWNYTPADAGWPVLQTACAAAGLTLKQVNSAQAGANVGWLCGLPGSSQACLLLHLEPDAYPPALVLSGLAQAKLDQLLAALRAGGVVIPLKAVVTPTNREWPFCELLAELLREHTALNAPQKTE